jgi:DNA-binding response OmpR family regulator
LTHREEGQDRVLPEPDLFLLDLVMRPESGLDFLKGWAASPWKKTPVLVLSGLDDPVAHERALQLGASEIIGKPASFAEWQEAVAKVRAFLERRSPPLSKPPCQC